MKKVAAFIIIVLVCCSCKLKDQQNDNESVPTIPNNPKDSTVVNDKDENGCLASAGYIWSKINMECVKCFTGIQLNPVDKPDNEDKTESAYVLFSEDTKQAEIFLPNESSSMVLKRTTNGRPWSFEDWQLIAQNGYILQKGEKNMFSGDGQIGNKVMGDDTEQ